MGGNNGVTFHDIVQTISNQEKRKSCSSIDIAKIKKKGNLPDGDCSRLSGFHNRAHMACGSDLDVLVLFYTVFSSMLWRDKLGEIVSAYTYNGVDLDLP